MQYSIVYFSEASKEKRFDAEFYLPKYEIAYSKIKKYKWKYLIIAILLISVLFTETDSEMRAAIIFVVCFFIFGVIILSIILIKSIFFKSLFLFSSVICIFVIELIEL